MKKISLPLASVLTSPNPVTLVRTEKPDGTTNLAAVSWRTFLSRHPDTIAFATAKTSYSGEMARRTGKVIPTVPGAAIAEAVPGGGSVTGRDADKARRFGVEQAEVEGSGVKIPAPGRVAIPRALKEYRETSDHDLYIRDAEGGYGDAAEEPSFAWNGRGKIAPAKMP